MPSQLKQGIHLAFLLSAVGGQGAYRFNQNNSQYKGLQVIAVSLLSASQSVSRHL